MKSLIVISLLAAFTLFAAKSQANEVLFADSDKTPFEQISDWVPLAEETSFEQSEGIYMGKCFSLAKTIPVSTTYLSILNKLVGEDQGPAFPAKTEAKAALLSVSSGSAIYTSIKSYMLSQWTTYKTVLRPNQPVSFMQYKIKGNVLSYNGYLFTIVKTSEEIPCNSFGSAYRDALCVGSVAPKNSVVRACYFYEKLSEED